MQFTKFCAYAGDESPGGCCRASVLAKFLKITDDLYAMISKKGVRFNTNNFLQKRHTRFFSIGSRVHVWTGKVSVG